MPNPTGINGHGEKNAPPDNVLRASLLQYAKEKQSQEQKRRSLAKDHGYYIGLWKLNKEENRLEIPSKRRLKPAEEEVRQAIVDEVEQDLNRGNGPDYIQDKLLLKHDLHVGRDLVTKIMKEYFPQDFVKRFPGKKPVRQNRIALQSIGPFREVHADGHEKLTSSALKMGSIGFAIYGQKDRWSDEILSLVCVPESRTAAAGGHVFLDFVEKVGGIPIQYTTDKGPEIGYQHAFMVVLRECYAPELDFVKFPPHVILKSTNNTPIEGFWRYLLEKTGLNLKDIILKGKIEYIYNSARWEHTSLFYWIFTPLIQKELNDFLIWWNHHKIRSQAKKLMPSGHVPAYAMKNPEEFGGIDCRIEVPKEAVSRLRQMLQEETMSRDECFRWYADDFAQAAQELWDRVGRPEISLHTAWSVFAQMAPLLVTALNATN